MKERPILFSGPMVRAILSGAKNQTRRIVKPQPPGWAVHATFDESGWGQEQKHQWCFNDEAAFEAFTCNCPHGVPGDRLLVKETYYQLGQWVSVPGVKTKGGRQKWKFIPQSDDIEFEPPPEYRKGRHHKDPLTVAWHKRLGRFMPRKYARLMLEIVSVRVERLQEISENDAKAEGIEGRWHPDDPKCWTWKDYAVSSWAPEPRFHYGSTVTPQSTYQGLWESINGEGSWEKNPWVWAITFKRVET